MNGYGSLFERLGSAADTGAGGNRDTAAVASVAAHLGKMLGTRAGSVQTLCDYGLPDLNDMRLSQHDCLSRARLAIERFIQAYEPRLHNVHVELIAPGQDVLQQSFIVQGMMSFEGVRRAVSFTALLDGRGQVQVTS